MSGEESVTDDASYDSGPTPAIVCGWVSLLMLIPALHIERFITIKSGCNELSRLVERSQTTKLVGVARPVQEQSGQKPAEVVSDSGHCSDANLGYLEKKKIAGFVAVDRESYRDREKSCPRGPLPKGATRVERMRRKLQTKKGAAIYSTRKTVVEPVFGQIKEARGFRRFLLRGLKKVQGEWAIVSLTHNLLKLPRLCYG